MSHLKQKIIVCIAMKEESDGVIESFVTKFNSSFDIEVLYTDIGLVNATYSLTKRLTELKNNNIQTSYVVNIGSAGGRNGLQVGDIVECSGFCLRDADQTAIGFPIGIININSRFADDKTAIVYNKTVTNYKKAICGSGNNFETTKPKLPECTVVEMEAAALAKVCIREGVRFVSLKYISDVDNSKDEGRQWQNNLHNTANTLLKGLQEVLYEL